MRSYNFKELLGIAQTNCLEISYDLPDNRRDAVLENLRAIFGEIEEIYPGDDQYSYLYKVDQLSIYVNYTYSICCGVSFEKTYNNVFEFSVFLTKNQLLDDYNFGGLNFLVLDGSEIQQCIGLKQMDECGRLSPNFAAFYFGEF